VAQSSLGEEASEMAGTVEHRWQSQEFETMAFLLGAQHGIVDENVSYTLLDLRRIVEQPYLSRWLGLVDERAVPAAAEEV
jgi:hypothetical protein